MKALRVHLACVDRIAAVALAFAAAGTALAQQHKYLIVSSPEYVGSAPLNQFIDFRTVRGYEVSVYSVPAGANREAIKAYIQSLWGTPDAPEFLLIVGDTSGATSRRFRTGRAKVPGRRPLTCHTRAWTAQATGIRTCSTGASQ